MAIIVQHGMLCVQVGLEEGADLPLPPPEPFQSQHQEHAQPIAQHQHQHQQLPQPPPNPASEGETSQRQRAQKEGALQPLPSRSSTDFPTSTPRGVSKRVRPDGSPTESPRSPEALPATTSYGLDVVTDTRLAAADTAGNDPSGIADYGQDDNSAAAVDHTAGDGYYESEEGQPTASHLLGRFPVLHRAGRLEEAAATLQQALGLMQSNRRTTVGRKASPLQDTVLPGGSSFVHEEGKAPYSGAKDTNGAQFGEAGDERKPGNGNISGSSAKLEHEVVAGDRLFESAAEASAIAGVMNDLGCTLQQVK